MSLMSFKRRQNKHAYEDRYYTKDCAIELCMRYLQPHLTNCVFAVDATADQKRLYVLIFQYIRIFLCIR